MSQKGRETELNNCFVKLWNLTNWMQAVKCEILIFHISIPLFLAPRAMDGMMDCRAFSRFFFLPRLLYHGIFTGWWNSNSNSAQQVQTSIATRSQTPTPDFELLLNANLNSKPENTKIQSLNETFWFWYLPIIASRAAADLERQERPREPYEARRVSQELSGPRREARKREGWYDEGEREGDEIAM